MSHALAVQVWAAALSPVEQEHLLEARQMQALSFAVHIPLALAVAAIVAGWGIAQSPDILPGLTVHAAGASHETLVAPLISIALGLIVLVSALVLRFGLVVSRCDHARRVCPGRCGCAAASGGARVGWDPRGGPNAASAGNQGSPDANAALSRGK